MDKMEVIVDRIPTLKFSVAHLLPKSASFGGVLMPLCAKKKSALVAGAGIDFPLVSLCEVESLRLSVLHHSLAEARLLMALELARRDEPNVLRSIHRMP